MVCFVPTKIFVWEGQDLLKPDAPPTSSIDIPDSMESFIEKNLEHSNNENTLSELAFYDFILENIESSESNIFKNIDVLKDINELSVLREYTSLS